MYNSLENRHEARELIVTEEQMKEGRKKVNAIMDKIIRRDYAAALESGNEAKLAQVKMLAELQGIEL